MTRSVSETRGPALIEANTQHGPFQAWWLKVSKEATVSNRLPQRLVQLCTVIKSTSLRDMAVC